MITAVFYNTEFRKALENWYFDLRVRVSQKSYSPSDIIVLGISDQTMASMDSAQPRVLFDADKKPFLSIESLTRIVKGLAKSEAKSIALLIPNHAFSHSDPKLIELIQIVSQNEKFLVGTTEYNRIEPGVEQIPDPLSKIAHRVFGYETFRRRSNFIVRDLPYMGYRGLQHDLMLPVKMAMTLSREVGEFHGTYTLNPMIPEQFETIDASLIDTNEKLILDRIKNKGVILGYVVPREIPFQTTDTMSVNTPLIGNPQNRFEGMPTTYLVANAVDNLAHGRIIKSANAAANLLQTALIITASVVLWELGSVVACICTAIMWVLLILIHSILISKFNILIPLADTFLFSSFATIFAATRMLKIELTRLASERAKAEAQKEIARVHSHFLDEFASWLQEMTRAIVSKIQVAQNDPKTNSPENEDLYARAFAAGEDFEQYLEAIRQIPELEKNTTNVSIEDISMEDLLNRIARRFQLKIQSKNLKLDIQVQADAEFIKSNQNLLDSIVYNLISNAIKYSPDHSNIVVTTKKHGRKTVITVADEGPGIPPEFVERIFEKFYRIQDERMYNASGTGLGLYLCRFFVRKLHGDISVDSRLGKGSTFTVTLP
jgi:signal transduction histidine kinase